MACPWSCYALQVLQLKGLDQFISHSSTKPEWGPIDSKRTKGWLFDVDGREDGPIDCRDPVLGCSTVRQLYQKAEPEF